MIYLKTADIKVIPKFHTQVVGSLTSMLEKNHDRCKVPVSGMISAISQHQKYVPLLAPTIPSLVSLLRMAKPRWAQLHRAIAYVASALTAMAVFPDEGGCGG